MADPLRWVEQKLAECTRSREAEITEIASHLIQSGGKRIRPVITLLTFSAFHGERQEDAVDIAAAMELIHAATLLHDDIIDGAEFRRGKVSAYKRYGLARTLVAGDFLFIKAFEFAGKFDDTVVQWTADACTSLTEGEILQGVLQPQPHRHRQGLSRYRRTKDRLLVSDRRQAGGVHRRRERRTGGGGGQLRTQPRHRFLR